MNTISANIRTVVHIVLFLIYAHNSYALPNEDNPTLYKRESRTFVIYGIASNGDLLWYNHKGFDNGENIWTNTFGVKVGNGWAGKKVISVGKGIVLTVDNTGTMRWYKHKGHSVGKVEWEGPKVIGSGWNFKKIFSGGDGVIYAIKDNGELLWYKADGLTTGTVKFSGPNRVGSGWGGAIHVFSIGGGIVYYINDKGELFWGLHRGYLTGKFDWAGNPKKISTGWNFKYIMGGGEGYIYGVNYAGDLLWYRHPGYTTGYPTFLGPKKIGTGWGGFSAVFLGDISGVSYAPPYLDCYEFAQQVEIGIIKGIVDYHTGCNEKSGSLGVFAAAFIGGAYAEARQVANPFMAPSGVKTINVKGLIEYAGAASTFGLGAPFTAKLEKTWDNADYGRADITSIKWEDIVSKIVDAVALAVPALKSKEIKSAVEAMKIAYDMSQMVIIVEELRKQGKLKTEIIDFTFSNDNKPHRIEMGIRANVSAVLTGEANASAVGRVTYMDVIFTYK